MPTGRRRKRRHQHPRNPSRRQRATVAGWTSTSAALRRGHHGRRTSRVDGQTNGSVNPNRSGTAITRSPSGEMDVSPLAALRHPTNDAVADSQRLVRPGERVALQDPFGNVLVSCACCVCRVLKGDPTVRRKLGDECFEHAMLFARTHVTQLTNRTSIDGAVASSWSPLRRYLSHDAEALHGLGLA